VAVSAPVHSAGVVLQLHVFEFNALSHSAPGLDIDGDAAPTSRRQHLYGRFTVQAQELETAFLPRRIRAQAHHRIVAGYREQRRGQVGVARVRVVEPHRVAPVGAHGGRHVNGGFEAGTDAGRDDDHRALQRQRLLIRPDERQRRHLRRDARYIQGDLQRIPGYQGRREYAQRRTACVAHFHAHPRDESGALQRQGGRARGAYRDRFRQGRQKTPRGRYDQLKPVRGGGLRPVQGRHGMPYFAVYHLRARRDQHPAVARYRGLRAAAALHAEGSRARQGRQGRNHVTRDFLADGRHEDPAPAMGQ